MCYFEVDIATICNEFQVPVSPFLSILESLTELQKDGLVTLSGTYIKVNPEVPQAVRIVSSLFDTYLTVENKRYARVS